jgi:2-amino-4-hydroxy-6-hydroxymethyldihydropteridine diphosphokinase
VPTILVAVGSNRGDRLAFLQAAVDALGEHFELTAVSHLYQTAPMYVVNQPSFLNGAVQARTEFSPLEVLRILKHTEVQVGRLPRERYGPREIDLDLVAYGSLQYRFTKDKRVWLDIPHPKTPERRFVLEPLADIDPLGSLPGLGRVDELLKQTEGQSESVQRVHDAILSI